MPHSPLNYFGRLSALVIAIAASACDRPSPTTHANLDQPTEPKVDKPSDDSPLPDLPLGRQGLLIAMLEASSAAIVGQEDAKQQDALKGRRFELRMRFGCPGATPVLERRWTYEKRSGALRVTVRPDIDQEVGEIADQSEGRAEEGASPAHERGFLIPNPTVLSAGCPSADYAPASIATSLRFGVIQRTDPQGARSRQLLDSYEVTKKIAEQEVPNQGLDLVIRGRLETEGQGLAIRCAPRGGMVECLALSTIDLVSIEDPSNGRLIAEWGQN